MPAPRPASRASPVGDVRGPVDYKRAMAAEMTLRSLRSAVARALAYVVGRGATMTTQHISVTVNGEAHEADVEPRLLLVHFLRDNLGLTGTHVGCDTSNCGACTVQVDGQSAKSLHDARGPGRWPRGQDHRGHGQRRRPPPAPAGVLGPARPAVRVLHAGHDHAGRLAARSRTPTRPRRRSGSGSAATCAAAPAT